MVRQPFQPASRGTPLDIYSREWNEILRQLREQERQQEMVARGRDTLQTILIRNDSGEAIPRGGVLAPVGTLISPDQEVDQNNPFKLDNFFDEFPLRGDAPATPSVRIAISREAMSDRAETGDFAISGIVPVRLEIRELHHRFAVPIPGNVTKLQSAYTGQARIVAKANDAAVGKDVWAVVDLQGDRIGFVKGVTAERIPAGGSGKATVHQAELGVGGQTMAKSDIYAHADWFRAPIAKGKEIVSFHFPGQQNKLEHEQPEDATEHTGWVALLAECVEENPTVSPLVWCSCVPSDVMRIYVRVQDIPVNPAGPECQECETWNNVERLLRPQNGSPTDDEQCTYVAQQAFSEAEGGVCFDLYPPTAEFPCNDPVTHGATNCSTWMELNITCDSTDYGDQATLDFNIGGCLFMRAVWRNLVYQDAHVDADELWVFKSCDNHGLGEVIGDDGDQGQEWDPQPDSPVPPNQAGENGSPWPLKDGISPDTLGAFDACGGFTVSFAGEDEDFFGYYNFTTGDFSTTAQQGYTQLSQSSYVRYADGIWVVMGIGEKFERFPPCALTTAIDPNGCNWLTTLQNYSVSLRFAR